MKKFLFAFAIIMLFSCNLKAQKEYNFAISFKPNNYSNIDKRSLEDFFLGHYVGIEFEKIISKNKKLSLILPFTYGDLHSYIFMDINSDGRDLYIAPGLRYYLKGFNKRNGFALSSNILLGHKVNSYGSRGPKFKTNGYFYGLLCNGHYFIKTKRNIFLNFELGLGPRIYDSKNQYTTYDYPDYKIVKTEELQFELIYNISFGFQYRF